MNQKRIREIAEIMKDNGLTLVEIAENDTVLHMERKLEGTPAVALSTGVVSEAAAMLPVITASEKEATVVDWEEIKSPMVGIFYGAAAPGAEDFVKVGDYVQKGDVVCVIEAMKLFNEITSEVAGRVQEICVANAQMVAYDQVLFKLAKE